MPDLSSPDIFNFMAQGEKKIKRKTLEVESTKFQLLKITSSTHVYTYSLYVE